MASLQAIAVRRAQALERMARIREAFAASYGIEIPEPPMRVAQPELQQAIDLEYNCEIFERVLAATSEAIGTAPGGVDPSMLDGSIASLKERLIDMDDLAALRLLRAAEAGGKTRAGALSAIDARMAELEAEQADTEESDDPEPEVVDE
jgi:hypothetical protein